MTEEIEVGDLIANSSKNFRKFLGIVEGIKPWASGEIARTRSLITTKVYVAGEYYDRPVRAGNKVVAKAADLKVVPKVFKAGDKVGYDDLEALPANTIILPLGVNEVPLRKLNLNFTYGPSNNRWGTADEHGLEKALRDITPATILWIKA